MLKVAIMSMYKVSLPQKPKKIANLLLYKQL
jgi:hypothetical protein